MEIRNMLSGNGILLGKYKIRGIVISDRIANNTQSANIVIQDATGGIVVRFSASKTSGTPVNHSFNLNDEVEIVLEGDSLSKFRGLLQISRAQVSEATKVGTGSISPRVATIPEIIANFNQWESTLVKVINVNLTPVDSTYSSSTSNTTNPRHINNGTDKMVLFTRFSATSSLNRATFYNDLMPNGVRSLTGLLTFFDIQQISIRNSSDVQ
jgi:DNA/RNA endonuclease YhcR with UshA esterase domain